MGFNASAQKQGPRGEEWWDETVIAIEDVTDEMPDYSAETIITRLCRKHIGTKNVVLYKFTGKEKDQTGLYYFGARYYDPKTSVWISPDPILNEYLDGDTGMGGIYNSRNLGMPISFLPAPRLWQTGDRRGCIVNPNKMSGS